MYSYGTPPPLVGGELIAAGPGLSLRAGYTIAHVLANPRRRSRGVRIIGRLLRYGALAGALSGIGFGAGYLLTLGKALAVTVTAAVVGGAVGTKLVLEDLAKIPFMRNMPITRAYLAGQAGGLFGLLPFGGAAAGLFAWFATGEGPGQLKEYIRRRIIEAGRRGVTGWGN